MAYRPEVQDGHQYVIATEHGYWVTAREGKHVYSRFLKDAARWQAQKIRDWGKKVTLISGETTAHLVDDALAPEEWPEDPKPR